MPALFLSLLGSKYLWYALAAAGLVAGFFIYRAHLIDEGEARIKVAVQAATQAEQAREAKVNQDWQQWAAGANHNADDQKAKFDALQKQLAVATANDNAVCLSGSVVDKLRAIGGASGQAAPAAAARRSHR